MARLFTTVIPIHAIRRCVLCAAVLPDHNSIAGDVHVRGAYPGFARRYFAEHDMNIEMLPEDAEILKNGTVDFVSISYYSSNCVSLTQEGAETTKGNGTVNIKNPYLKASDWDGRSMLSVSGMSLTRFMTATRFRS